MFLTFLVAATSARLGPVVRIDLPAGVAEVAAPHGPAHLNVRTAAAWCARSPCSEWPSLCDDFVSAVAHVDPDIVRGWAGSLSEALPRLRLRLHPDVASASLGGGFAAFSGPGGLGASLVYQVDGALVPVPVVDRQRWDVGDDELFALAGSQTLAVVRHAPTVVVPAGAGWFTVTTGCTALTATLALAPERLARGGDGVLIGLASATDVLAVPLAPEGPPQELGPALAAAVDVAAGIRARDRTPPAGGWLLHDASAGSRQVPPSVLVSEEEFDAWRS